MKISQLGIDTIELGKRYIQHKNDLEHIGNDQYKTFQEKCKSRESTSSAIQTF